jgi:pimeloyl-ACP methyl ester carboxylesterase
MEAPRLYVDAAGSGPALVLGHGLGGSARNWRPQLRALRPARRVVAFDTRGHARSAAPNAPGAYALSELVGDLARVVDEQVGGPAVVGGLSLGAGVALALALEQPESVDGLVLAAYPATTGFAAVTAPFAAAIERDGLDAAGARYVWGPESGLDAEAAGLVRMGFLEHAPHAIAAILRECLPVIPVPAELGARLRGFVQPVLLLVGARDVGSLSVCRELAVAFPNARLEIIPEAGHVVNLAQPKRFNAALLEFLDAIGPAS